MSEQNPDIVDAADLHVSKSSKVALWAPPSRLSIWSGRVIDANRRSTFQATVVIMLAVLISVSTTAIIIASRPTHVNGAALVDTSGNVVETGTSLQTADLVALTAEGDLNKLDHLKSIHLVDVEAATEQIVAAHATNTSMPSGTPPVRSVTVDSWSWVDAYRMTITATDGTRILVSNGQVESQGPPDGYASFHATGVGFGTDHRTNLTALAEVCDMHNCPKSVCAAATYRGLTMRVDCGSSTVWQWPTGVTLPKSSERRLESGNILCYRACGRSCDWEGRDQTGQVQPADMRRYLSCYDQCCDACDAAAFLPMHWYKSGMPGWQATTTAVILN